MGKVKLSDVLVYEQPTKYIVKSDDYSDSFKTPVLTAGKTFILGYTKEDEGICNAQQNPVIIFDDFTSESKFVTFDFKVKSSAMKIIRTRKPEDSLKYFYYAMQSLEYTPDSHKRVWISEYSKLEVPYPNCDMQREIVNRLEKVEALIAAKTSEMNALDELVKSRFMEMFGDPIDNPLGWEKYALGMRCIIVTGNTPSRADRDNYGTYLEWIKSDNINTPETYLTTAQEFLSEKGFKKCRYVESGSILMTCIAGSIGCIGNVGVANRRVAFNQQINAIVPSQDETMYIYWLMKLSKPYIQNTISMSLKGILSKNQLAALNFPFPPINLQREFSTLVHQIDKSKLVIKKTIAELEELKSSLMQKYFFD